MKTYIVWFDEAYEPAEDAAAAINGQIIPLMPDQSIEQAVKDALSLHDHPPYAVSMIEEVAGFIADHNQSGRSANRSENCYNCVVFLEEGMTAEQWLDFIHNENFADKITPDQAAGVFVEVLHGSSDICYQLLNDLLCNYSCDEPNMDFILMPNRPDLAGFDDLSYLLRSVDWTEDNYRLHLGRLEQTDLLWLYKRNLTTINQWMAVTGVDLLQINEMLRPEIDRDMVIDTEAICCALVRDWTYSLMFC